MRTAQYTFVLVAQILMICSILTFGDKVIGMSQNSVVPSNTTPVDQLPPSPGLDNLYDQLSR